MPELSPTSNLLEDENYKYELQDVRDPHLYRDLYTYTEIPKVTFNHRRVPIEMPREIWITDTSLRDGMQSVEPYSVDQIVKIYKLLSFAGESADVADPWYTGDFATTYRDVLKGCQALLTQLMEQA